MLTNNLKVWALIFALAFVGIESVEAQLRGRALYDHMKSERLTTTEGIMRVSWLPDGRSYYVTENIDGNRTFFRVDVETEEKSSLFDETTLTAIREAVGSEDAEGTPFFQFSYVFDNSAIMFSVDGVDYIHDLDSNTTRTLKKPELEPRPQSTDNIGSTHMAATQIWTGTYSPDFSMFGFVRDFDLYVADTDTGEETRLTRGGSGMLMNGRPDWVYPEEAGQRIGFVWSPDGTKIAYLQWDESEVYQYPLVHALTPEADLELEHYPKPGETNPTVNLFVVDIATGEQVQIQTRSSSENYILKPTWRLDGSELTFQRLNRHQNKLELLAANPESGRVRVVLEEEDDAYVLLHDDFELLEDGERFLWTSERTGWRHIYIFNFSGQFEAALTGGGWAVGSISLVDEANGRVFFSGYSEDGLETHFFSAGLDGSGYRRLTTHPGSHRASISPTGAYFTDSYSSFDRPPVVDMIRGDGTLVRNLMTTDTSKLDELGLEPPELVIFKAADGVTDLHGLLFKPAGYNPDMAYPLLVPVYGGPYSKAISNAYLSSRGEQQLAQLGFMVWRADNRGLTRRGKEFENMTYLKLGQVDLDDQAAGVLQISQRHYVDGGRVGIYGGSYGGYMTTMALVKKPEVFHVGVASAPVTDWRNYDTIYTERYMRTPQENPDGYDLGAAMPFARQLTGKLLIAHGSIDNNVNPTNTLQMINALVEAGKKFDLMYYPENRHGFRGAAGRHFSEMRLDYLLQHLDPPAWPWTR